MPTIAVDAMGGDHAPDAVVQGVAQISLATDIECLLVGDERRIQSVLEGVSYNPEHIAILHASEAIGMAEELVHFALMGSAYARRISKVASPAVGLLNMGREERATIWQRGCRRAPPDRSPQPP